VNHEFIRMRGDLEETQRELKRVQVGAPNAHIWGLVWVLGF